MSRWHRLRPAWFFGAIALLAIHADMGGHLPIAETAEEHAFLQQLVGGENAWLGLDDEEVDGVYRWVDGTLPVFTAWRPGDPHGIPGGAAPTEDHVVLWNNGRAWADVDWYHTHFVCEWDD